MRPHADEPVLQRRASPSETSQSSRDEPVLQRRASPPETNQSSRAKRRIYQRANQRARFALAGRFFTTLRSVLNDVMGLIYSIPFDLCSYEPINRPERSEPGNIQRGTTRDCALQPTVVSCVPTRHQPASTPGGQSNSAPVRLLVLLRQQRCFVAN